MKGLGGSKIDKLRDKNRKQQNGEYHIHCWSEVGTRRRLITRGFTRKASPFHDCTASYMVPATFRSPWTCAVDKVKQGNVFSIVHYQAIIHTT
jgi:hypothetical protein